MEHNELPLGLGMALAQHPDALRKYAELAGGQKAEVLKKARSVSSKREMQELVNSLSGQQLL